MQTNSPQFIPLENKSKNSMSMSQSILTRSLPSIIGSLPSSADNVLVSEIYQSHMSSTAKEICTLSRDPTSVALATDDDNNNISQESSTIFNCSQNQRISQKFNLTTVSMTKPNLVRAQPSYSTVISNSKNSEKYKKKVRPRYKSKYLLRVIKVQDDDNIKDKILTFDMTLPMTQMRFSCRLRNGMNSLDVSNSVVEAGKITGELCKKDILESLVNTVKKICQQLTEDRNSIPLNEDYIFYPCLQNSGLLKVVDNVSLNTSSLDIDNMALGMSNNANMSNQARVNLDNDSNEKISFSMGHLFTEITEGFSNELTEYHVAKPVTSNNVPLVCEDEINTHTIVSTKCQCPSNDLTLKVPEYIFSTVKQIVDKLMNLYCKGAIILPQSNDFLTRNFRILEIPADHIFIGLPCSDSHYNVIKGEKDKDFIIARDTRDPDNVTEKCVYQRPSDGAVLLDSLGEIKYIQKPSLIIPARLSQGSEKTEVRELPEELTHHKYLAMDCEQIISLLQSLALTSNINEQSKDESFDSPVLLERISEPPTKLEDSQEVIENNKIQFDRISCQYISLPNSTNVRLDETALAKDVVERNFPRHELRSRKISNEFTDSTTTFRTRATSAVPYVNETSAHKHGQRHQAAGAINNNGNGQHVSKAAGSASGHLHQTNHNTSIQHVPHYCNSSHGPTPRGTIYHKNVIIPAVPTNLPHLLPDQMIVPSAMSIINNAQLQQDATGKGTTVPASVQPYQLIPNLNGLLPISQGTFTQIPSYIDQNSIQTPTCIVRQLPTSTLPYHDHAGIQSIIAENLSAQLKAQQTNAQLQPQAVLIPNISLTPLIQKDALLATNIPSDTAIIHQVHECHHADDANVDNKPKVEQTIGRFIIKPVTDTKMNLA